MLLQKLTFDINNQEGKNKKINMYKKYKCVFLPIDLLACISSLILLVCIFNRSFLEDNQKIKGLWYQRFSSKPDR